MTRQDEAEKSKHKTGMLDHIGHNKHIGYDRH